MSVSKIGDKIKMNELEGFGLDETPYISTCEKGTYGISVIAQMREANMWSFNKNHNTMVPHNVHRQIAGGMK